MSSKEYHIGIKSPTPSLSVKTDRDTFEWFHDAKSRTQERTSRDLTHEEFTRLLLEIYEFHEDVEADQEGSI